MIVGFSGLEESGILWSRNCLVSRPELICIELTPEMQLVIFEGDLPFLC